MHRTRLRSGLLNTLLVFMAAGAWLYLAPASIGGSTSYITTSGISMAPRFHTGDLALVRPADHYDVGEIVAYRSSVLHVVVLHRIIARDGDRYVFKGDNNNFLDPTHPTRSALVGALWLHIPHGGWVVAWLHTPLGAGAVIGAALLVLFGVGKTRRRRRRRRNVLAEPARDGVTPVNTPQATNGKPPAEAAPRVNGAAPRHARLPRGPWRITVPTALAACGTAAVVFLGLGLFAFGRPLTRSATAQIAYTQHMNFGYRGRVAAGLVYPSGALHTGDPIFVHLVHRLRVVIDYRLATAGAHRVAGTVAVALGVIGPGGWSRDIPLAPSRPFSGDHLRTAVTLDLPYLQTLVGQVQQLTGVSSGAYTVTVEPQVHIEGRLAGQPLRTTFEPTLGFQLNPLQLQFTGSGSSSNPQAGLRRSQRGTVPGIVTRSNDFSLAGHKLPVATVRWIALVGFLLAAAIALSLAIRLKLSPPPKQAARIQAQYGHLIVPISAANMAGSAPVDVADINALVRLAERNERLILHHQAAHADTYLVEDGGTLYRYQLGSDRSLEPEQSASAVATVDASDASPVPDPPPAEPARPSPPAGRSRQRTEYPRQRRGSSSHRAGGLWRAIDELIFRPR